MTRCAGHQLTAAEDSTVSTGLLDPGTPDAEGVLDGDLHVVGAVQSAGIRDIRGRVIGDGTFFGSVTGFSGRVASLAYNRAKTGTLKRYRKPLQDSLAGYVFGRSKRVAFSIVREQAESRFASRSSIDRMTDAIAHHCHDRRR